MVSAQLLCLRPNESLQISDRKKRLKRKYSDVQLIEKGSFQLKFHSNQTTCHRKSQVKAMDELPELPFEQVLSYLNLKDRLKARTVSRAWRNTFDRYSVKTLCYSARSSDFIFEKSRWVKGEFAENFISSTRFASFFDTFGQTILSSLKHLRLCDIDLCEGDQTTFVRILNPFRQLGQLGLIRVKVNQQ